MLSILYRCCRQFCVLFITLGWLWSAEANVLESVRVWPSPDETRVVIDMQSEVEFSYFVLDQPDRLVVDLKNTTLKAILPFTIADSAVLAKIRASSPPQKSTYRLVLELKQATSPQLFTLAPTPGGQYGHRLVVDLPHQVKTQASSSEAKVSKDASQLAGTADIVVAIDAGHGGEDPGSIGPSGRYEKDITLSVSKKLVDQINLVPGMKAVLTRSGDYFVNLNKRSDIARKNKAHLLVSIHADAFHTPQPRGASVFVLNTRRANTEISRWVENHEQQSELLGGAGEVLAKTNADKNVSQTLLDLQFSHSQKEGHKVATHILQEMGKVAHLHKKDPVNASLAVLKSPDIPSVLVETGFISNPSEERLLFQASHQDALARALAKAIVTYFETSPPEGTLFANRAKAQRHVVKKGENLSLIAQRYGVSVSALVQENRLKNTSLNVGQVLVISGGQRLPIDVPVVQNPVQTQTISHQVKAGETLSQLSAHYKVSIDAIKKENRLSSDRLLVGKKLQITVSLKDKPLRTHNVVKGEYLGKIAQQYGVSVVNIRRANQLTSDELAVGQRLIIPNK